jgi:ribonuclease HI
MAKKYYVVWAGHKPGIYEDWASCKQQVDRFAGARYKSFPSLAEAEAAFQGAVATPKKRQTKKSDEAAVAAPTEGFDVAIYCDGACIPNPGEAGSGAAVYRQGQLAELWYGLYNPQGTNNTAELNALHQSLLMAEKAAQAGESVMVLCDSKYAINCISSWAYGWKDKGWKKKTGEIKNLDIIKPTHILYNRIKDSITLSHVRGHSGIEGNELADRMTMLAVDEKAIAFCPYDGARDVPTLLKMRTG